MKKILFEVEEGFYNLKKIKRSRNMDEEWKSMFFIINLQIEKRLKYNFISSKIKRTH